MKAQLGSRPSREFQALIDKYQSLHVRVEAFVSDCGHPVPRYAAEIAFGLSKMRVLHLLNDYYNTREAA